MRWGIAEQDDIMPAWEDDANAEGGKWTLTIKSNPPLLDRSWLWLVLALVGEQLDDVSDEVCGAGAPLPRRRLRAGR